MSSKDNIFSNGPQAADVSDVMFPHTESHLFPATGECSEVRVECAAGDYSASRIARAVEDADAHLLNLNVTSLASGPGSILVDLRVNHRDSGSVTRSLERYGFTVVRTAGGYDRVAEVGRSRVRELMAHLEV